MTFRLPVRDEWRGKTIEFVVLLSGRGAQEARAELHLVTPTAPAVERRLQVRPADAR
jgi:hypothetical protein